MGGGGGGGAFYLFVITSMMQATFLPFLFSRVFTSTETIRLIRDRQATLSAGPYIHADLDISSNLTFKGGIVTIAR